MAKEFKFDRFSKGKNLNVNISELALKNQNSKILEKDSQNLESAELEKESEIQILDNYVSSVKPQGELESSTLPDMSKIEKVSTQANIEARLLAEKNRVQTEYKQGTNGVQNDIETEYKQGTNGVQNDIETEYKQGTQQGTKSKQTEYKQGTNGVQNWTYFQIKGNEKKLLDFVFTKCDQIASRISPPLSPEILASVYGEVNLKNKNTAKVCLRRLVTDKKMIKRLGSVCGRGGYTQVELSEHLFLTIKQSLTEYKQGTNGVQNDNKQGTQQGTQQGTNGPSSSSTILLLNKGNKENKETTTSVEIPNFYKNIITKQECVKAIEKGLYSESDLQKTLNETAYDFEQGYLKKIISPQAFIRAKLSKGEKYESKKFELDQISALDVELKEKQKIVQELNMKKAEILKTEFDIFVNQNENWKIILRDFNNGFLPEHEPAFLITFEKYQNFLKGNQ